MGGRQLKKKINSMSKLFIKQGNSVELSSLSIFSKSFLHSTRCSSFFISCTSFFLAHFCPLTADYCPLLAASFLFLFLSVSPSLSLLHFVQVAPNIIVNDIEILQCYHSYFLYTFSTSTTHFECTLTALPCTLQNSFIYFM